MHKRVFWSSLTLGLGMVGGKLISLLFLYLLATRLQDELYYYTYAYIPFSLFLDFASLGLIPGTSKAISSLEDEKRRIFLLKRCTYYIFLLGVINFIVFIIFSRTILSRYYNEIIINNLYCASLSIIIYPLYSFFRGYLQGRIKVFPVALAIIIENTTRVLLFIYISTRYNNTSLYSLIFISNFISYLSGLLFLTIFIVKDLFKGGTSFNALSYLAKIGIPFGVITLFFTIFQLIDAIELPLLGIDGITYTAYMYKATRLIFLPIILCQSVAGVISPKMNYLKANNKEKVEEFSTSITGFMLSLIILLTYIISYYSKEIYSLFYKDIYYYVLKDSAILIFFIGFYKVLIGIAQGTKRFNLIVTVTIISAIFKLILNYVFIIRIGYRGGITSTIIALIICMLGAYYVLYKEEIHILKYNIITIATSIISLATAVLYSTIIRVIYPNGINNYLFLCFIILFYIFNTTFLNYLKSLYTKEAHPA